MTVERIPPESDQGRLKCARHRDRLALARSDAKRPRGYCPECYWVYRLRHARLTHAQMRTLERMKDQTTLDGKPARAVWPNDAWTRATTKVLVGLVARGVLDGPGKDGAYMVTVLGEEVLAGLRVRRKEPQR